MNDNDELIESIQSEEEDIEEGDPTPFLFQSLIFYLDQLSGVRSKRHGREFTHEILEHGK